MDAIGRIIPANDIPMKPDAIILHNSATKDGPAVSWGAIRRYHTSWKCDGRIIAPGDVAPLQSIGRTVHRPWYDIGYHFGLELVGETYEIFAGRMPDVTGAHCKAGGMNNHSLGVCFVGDYDRQTVPADMWTRGLSLVRYLMRAFAIPMRRVIGHREVDPSKTCPGSLFDLDLFRSDLTGV